MLEDKSHQENKKQDEYKIVFEKAKQRLKRKLNLDEIHPIAVV